MNDALGSRLNELRTVGNELPTCISIHLELEKCEKKNTIVHALWFQILYRNISHIFSYELQNAFIYLYGINQSALG